MWRESIRQNFTLYDVFFIMRINCMFLSYQPFPLTSGNADVIFIPLISKGSENIFKQGRFKWLRFSSVDHAS